MKTIRSIFKLLRSCLSTKEGKIGISFFVGIFMLNIIGVKVSLELIKWNKIFYDSLESRDLLVALQQVGAFFILAGFQAFIALLSTVAGGMMSSNGFFVNLLQIRWRKVLTEFSLNRWFRNKAFWYLDTSEKTGLDNPDQRIA